VGRELEKLANSFDFLPINQKRSAVDFSMPSVKSFGRQSSKSGENSLGWAQTSDTWIDTALIYRQSYG
jgi:hypothetical protein